MDTQTRKQKRKDVRQAKLELRKAWRATKAEHPHIVTPSEAREFLVQITGLSESFDSDEWVRYQIDQQKIFRCVVYRNFVCEGDETVLPIAGNRYGDMAVFQPLSAASEPLSGHLVTWKVGTGKPPVSGRRI